MMQFFRKYQRYFFIVLTIIIIISFSFFGTYSSLAMNEMQDPVVVTTVDGSEVTRSYIDAMTRFIGTDNQDKVLNGGQWGPNFLNDGVVRKDFLENGLVAIVAKPFMDDLKQDMDARLVKEKHYQPYVHPSEPRLGALGVWDFLAPSIKTNLQLLQKSEPVLTEETLEARVQLYLEEKKFPSQYLRQILRYQETENSGVPPDRSLSTRDLNLFGYRTLEDWFGPRFLTLVSEVIINGASIAERQGYRVSDADALADLLYNNEVSFRQLQKAHSHHLGVRSSQEYFKEQLRLLGMDQKMAVGIWKQVMLFRLLASNSSAVFVDSLIYDQFQSYAGQSREVSLYELEPALRITKAGDLQKLDTYLLAITGKEAEISVPTQYKSVEDIRKETPELVQKQYILKVAEVKLKDLQLNVPLKQAWDWEASEGNWQKFIVSFPELGKKLDLSKEERIEKIDNLDRPTRARLDAFAKEEIVKMHPEWIEEALENAESEEIKISIQEKSPTVPLSGIKDVAAFQKLLEQATLMQDSKQSTASVEGNNTLSNFSQDGQIFYRIEVLEKDSTFRVMSFEQALKDKTLDRLLNARLEKAYKAMIAKNTSLFLDASGKTKKFGEVKAEVAEKVFTPLYDKIVQYADNHGFMWHEDMGIVKGDFAADYRFLAYINEVRERVIAGDENAVVKSGEKALAAAFEPEKMQDSLLDQFKVQQSTLEISRKEKGRFDPEIFFDIKVGDFSKVMFLPKEGSFFFKVLNEKMNTDGREALMKRGQQLLQNSATTEHLKQCLQEMIEKKAIILTPLSSFNTDGLTSEQAS